jgi:hypothetical protein
MLLEDPLRSSEAIPLTVRREVLSTVHERSLAYNNIRAKAADMGVDAVAVQKEIEAGFLKPLELHSSTFKSLARKQQRKLKSLNQVSSL